MHACQYATAPAGAAGVPAWRVTGDDASVTDPAWASLGASPAPAGRRAQSPPRVLMTLGSWLPSSPAR